MCDALNSIVRVMIVEDDPDAASRLASAVARDPRLGLVAEASCGSDALARLAEGPEHDQNRCEPPGPILLEEHPELVLKRARSMVFLLTVNVSAQRIQI